jgi:hypothetical protein
MKRCIGSDLRSRSTFRKCGQPSFFLLRELQDRLHSEAPFTIDRLRFA